MQVCFILKGLLKGIKKYSILQYTLHRGVKKYSTNLFLSFKRDKMFCFGFSFLIYGSNNFLYRLQYSLLYHTRKSKKITVQTFSPRVGSNSTNLKKRIYSLPPEPQRCANLINPWTLICNNILIFFLNMLDRAQRQFLSFCHITLYGQRLPTSL